MRLGTESDNYMLSLMPTLLSELLFSVELKKIKGYVSLREEQEKSICGQAPTFF